VVIVSFFNLRRPIFQVLIFSILINLSRPSVKSFLMYFYTAKPDCVPGGPNLSYTFVSYVGLISAVAVIVATVAYQNGLSKVPLRAILIVTAVAKGSVAVLDIVMVKRWNITTLHIPDTVVFALNEGVLWPMSKTIEHIPIKLLIAYVMPKNVENSLLAFLTGMHNFTMLISKLAGLFIGKWAGLHTLPPCKFDQLWWLVLICHVACPIVIGVASVWILPKRVEEFAPSSIQTEEMDGSMVDDSREAEDAQFLTNNDLE